MCFHAAMLGGTRGVTDGSNRFVPERPSRTPRPGTSRSGRHAAHGDRLWITENVPTCSGPFGPDANLTPTPAAVGGQPWTRDRHTDRAAVLPGPPCTPRSRTGNAVPGQRIKAATRGLQPAQRTSPLIPVPVRGKHQRFAAMASRDAISFRLPASRSATYFTLSRLEEQRRGRTRQRQSPMRAKLSHKSLGSF